MSTMSSSPVTPPHSLGSGVAHLRAKWGWIVALGVIYMIYLYMTNPAKVSDVGLVHLDGDS